MALKPEYSVMGGIALATMVFAVHQQATPSQADIQALPAGTADIDSAEKKATWLSAGAVSVVSLLAKDPTMFVIGSGMVIAMAFWTRHSNYVEGVAGKFMSPAENTSAGVEMEETQPYEMFNSGEFSR